MCNVDLKSALASAQEAASTTGKLLRRNLHSSKKVKVTQAHDIKLDLDIKSQRLIEKILHSQFPDISVLGEEGVKKTSSNTRWVIDPIDGTVNYAYGIPHACVSIALQSESNKGVFQTELGVVYDPFCDEMWTAIRGRKAYLNGKPTHVSSRKHLSEAILSIGFAKLESNLQRMLPCFKDLVSRVRKIRIMGAAALDLVYVASGRMDAYLETGVRLWDIAAGGLILECAGGEFYHKPIPGEHTYHVLANNGFMRKPIEKLII